MAQSAYMPRLDGLRALAIGGVLIEHFAPSPFLRSFSPGGAGVTLFFVLSGFLITRILVGYRDSKTAAAEAARHFYWRRFCRLSPPLYLALGLGVIAGYSTIRSDWWVHAFYLTNFSVGLAGRWNTSADHFWSLAVEEQFYLLWFFVVMWTPKRHLLTAILVSFAITIAFRGGVFLQGRSELTSVLLPGSIAFLAAGALLVELPRWPRLAWLSRILSNRINLIGSGVTFLTISLALPRAGHSSLTVPLGDARVICLTFFLTCLVYSAIPERQDRGLDWLSWAPLRYVGKISYGVYVYHEFVAAGLRSLHPLPVNWLSFLLFSACSIGVASLSWIYMERPILQMKDRVRLQPRSGWRRVADIKATTSG